MVNRSLNIYVWIIYAFKKSTQYEIKIYLPWIYFTNAYYLLCVIFQCVISEKNVFIIFQNVISKVYFSTDIT